MLYDSHGQPLAVTEADAQVAESLGYLRERIAELEFALEDRDWFRIDGELNREFSRDGLRKIITLSRLMALKNPIVSRAIDVQRFYIWAQGVSITADQDSDQKFIDTFNADPGNDTEFASFMARNSLEIECAVTGNLFFAFFVGNGSAKIRSIPVEEIVDIVCNPDDRREPWLYKRQWNQAKGGGLEGAVSTPETITAYYPDWRFQPPNKPERVGGVPVVWDIPVHHLRVGGFHHWKFGVPEIYSAIDWAKGYKEFLEDWATIQRALARFAFALTTKGGARGVAAAKTKLASTQSLTRFETNPPPVTGSTFIASDGNRLEPVKARGASESAEEGRRIFLMAAAGLGLPETFFGDVSVGTLATATSLDRPTELRFTARQKMWADEMEGIYEFLIRRSRGNQRVQSAKDVAVSVDFPPVVTRNPLEAVKAVVAAATLDGGVSAGVFTDEFLVRKLLEALGEDRIEDVMRDMGVGESALESARDLDRLLAKMGERRAA